ncbi:MAG: FecR family protein [Verrucomicrobiota bacterium]|nr:FecR family protein [Verrucomicrobiota bacterium]
MNNRTIAVIISIVLMPITGISLLAGPLTTAQVTAVVNDVKVVSSSGQKSAKVTDIVAGQESVKTGQGSRAELTFTDKTLARIGANSMFSFKGGTRDMELKNGTMLLQVPKGAGGAKISTAAVTAAITGTTIMIEYTPGSYTKVIVLEGSLKLSLSNRMGESTIIDAGRMVIMPPNAKTIPLPVDVDIKTITKTSRLMIDVGDKEIDMKKIEEAIAQQEKKQEEGKLNSTPLFVDGNKVSLLNDQAIQQIASNANQPNKFAKPTVSAGTFTMGSDAQVITDPEIKSGGVTLNGTIWKPGDGSFTSFAFGGADLPIKEPSEEIAVFKAEKIVLTGAPASVVTEGGPSKMALIGVNGLSVESGSHAWTGINGLMLGSDRGDVSVVSGANLSVPGGLFLLAPQSSIFADGNIQATELNYGEGQNVFIGGRSTSSGDFFVHAEGGVSVDGDMQAAGFTHIEAGGQVDIDGSVSGGLVAVSAGGDVNLTGQINSRQVAISSGGIVNAPTALMNGGAFLDYLSLSGLDVSQFSAGNVDLTTYATSSALGYAGDMYRSSDNFTMTSLAVTGVFQANNVVVENLSFGGDSVINYIEANFIYGKTLITDDLVSYSTPTPYYYFTGDLTFTGSGSGINESGADVYVGGIFNADAISGDIFVNSIDAGTLLNNSGQFIIANTIYVDGDMNANAIQVNNLTVLGDYYFGDLYDNGAVSPNWNVSGNMYAYPGSRITSWNTDLYIAQNLDSLGNNLDIFLLSIDVDNINSPLSISSIIYAENLNARGNVTVGDLYVDNLNVTGNLAAARLQSLWSGAPVYSIGANLNLFNNLNDAGLILTVGGFIDMAGYNLQANSISAGSIFNTFTLTTSSLNVTGDVNADFIQVSGNMTIGGNVNTRSLNNLSGPATWNVAGDITFTSSGGGINASGTDLTVNNIDNTSGSGSITLKSIVANNILNPNGDVQATSIIANDVTSYNTLANSIAVNNLTMNNGSAFGLLSAASGTWTLAGTLALNSFGGSINQPGLAIDASVLTVAGWGDIELKSLVADKITASGVNFTADSFTEKTTVTDVWNVQALNLRAGGTGVYAPNKDIYAQSIDLTQESTSTLVARDVEISFPLSFHVGSAATVRNLGSAGLIEVLFGNLNVSQDLSIANNVELFNGTINVGGVVKAYSSSVHTITAQSIVAGGGMDFKGDDGFSFGGSFGHNITVNADSILIGSGGINEIDASGGDGDFGFGGGNGGSVTVNATAGPLVVSSKVLATTGRNNGVTAGNGGTININAADAALGGITVQSSAVVKASDDGVVDPARSSSVGGTISMSSSKTTGPAITIQNSSQLLALVDAIGGGPGGQININSAGGDINLAGILKASGSGSKLEVINNNGGTINIASTSQMNAELIKMNAMGPNGSLIIGGGSMSADSVLKLYAGDATGGLIRFTGDATLSSTSAADIAAKTVQIDSGKSVNISGPAANVFTDVPNYNGGAYGNFTGSGINSTQPYANAPAY